MDSVDNNMNIKTSRGDLSRSSPQTSRAPDSETKPSTPVDGSTTGSDTVTFTNAAASMLKLQETLANIPDIDNSRVADIKASIADGSYQVEPEKIVSNLLNLEKELL